MRDKRSEEYYNEPEDGFYPISETDCNILNEFEKILEFALRDVRVYEIFKKYKTKTSDDKILLLLQKLSAEIQENGIMEDIANDDDDDALIVFISFEGKDIPVRNIKMISRTREYNDSKECLEYLIILNYNFNEDKFMTNIRFAFYTEKSRDIAYQQLRVLLELNKVKFVDVTKNG